MYVQVGRCYYHPERGAVATCTKCGVGICRECTVKDDRGTILCRRCGNAYLKQEHKEHRKQLKAVGGRFRSGKEFIIPGIIGALIVITLGVLTFCGVLDAPASIGNAFFDFLTYFVLAYIFFSIPFGYIALSDLFTPKYDTLWNHAFNFALKIVALCFVGWIIFTFFWVRFIIEKSKYRQNKI